VASLAPSTSDFSLAPACAPRMTSRMSPRMQERPRPLTCLGLRRGRNIRGPRQAANANGEDSVEIIEFLIVLECGHVGHLSKLWRETSDPSNGLCFYCRSWGSRRPFGDVYTMLPSLGANSRGAAICRYRGAETLSQDVFVAPARIPRSRAPQPASALVASASPSSFGCSVTSLLQGSRLFSFHSR
jgi:hypothetical protein